MDHSKKSCQELHDIVLSCIDSISKNSDPLQFESLNEVWGLLYNKSLEENYWWDFCPFKVWEDHLGDWLFSFLNENPDAEARDFWNELNKDQEAKYCGLSEFKNERLMIWPYQLIVTFNIDTGYPETESEILLSDYLDSRTLLSTFYTERKKYDYLIEKLSSESPEEDSDSAVEPYEPEVRIGHDNLEIAERYYLLEKSINLSDKLTKTGYQKQSLNHILAYMMGCHPDNARKLLNGTYSSYNNLLDNSIRIKELDQLLTDVLKKG